MSYAISSTPISAIPGMECRPAATGWEITLNRSDWSNGYWCRKNTAGGRGSVDFYLPEGQAGERLEKLRELVEQIDTGKQAIPVQLKDRKSAPILPLQTQFSDRWITHGDVLTATRGTRWALFQQDRRLARRRFGDGYDQSDAAFDDLYDAFGIGRFSTVEIYDGMYVIAGVLYQMTPSPGAFTLFFHPRRADGTPGEARESAYLPRYCKIGVRALDGSWKEVRV